MSAEISVKFNRCEAIIGGPGCRKESWTEQNSVVTKAKQKRTRLEVAFLCGR